MLHRLIQTLSLLLWAFSSLAQQEDDVRKQIDQKAREGGYGVFYTNVSNTVQTTPSQSFIGIRVIPLDLKNTDSLLESPELKVPGIWEDFMKHCRTLTTTGVSLRKKGDALTAFLCYRIPLEAVCKKADWAPAKIISTNYWMAVQDMIHRTDKVDLAEQRAVDQAQLEARALLAKYGRIWETLLNDDKEEQVFLLYRRMAGLSGAHTLSSNLILRKTRPAQSSVSLAVFSAALEHLAELTISDFKITDSMDPEGKDHDLNLKELWLTYLQIRNRLPLYAAEVKNQYQNLLIQLELTRLFAANIGGAFGHRISYQIAEYLQVITRDFAYLDYLKGQPLQSFITMEYYRSKSLNDWIGRAHPNTRYQNLSGGGGAYRSNQFKLIKPAGIQEIADKLSKDSSYLLSYMYRPDGYLVWLITPDLRLYSAEIRNVDSLIQNTLSLLPYVKNAGPGTPGQLKGRGAVVSSNSKAQKPETVLRKLYDTLLPDSIGNIISAVNNGKLIIIPDNKLEFLPFAALIRPDGQYLIDHFTTVFWPSVTAGLLLNDADETYRALFTEDSLLKSILIVGDPLFKSNYTTTHNGKTVKIELSPLPGTRREAESIGKLFNCVPKLQNEANTSELFNFRKRNSIIHLATHGYANTEDAMQSFLAFSDGPLYADQLYENAGFMRSRLIVLSACQTGLGMNMEDSPISLTNAVLIAGANAVVSTYWSVDDEATASLMISFYQQLKAGKKMDDALWAAQLELKKKKEWSSPFYWAAFRLTGVTRNPLRN